MLLHEYNPNLRELSEEILLGPQAEVLEKINAFNQSWIQRVPDLKHIKCTKTFRWSPGMVEIVKTATMYNVLQWHKKGNVKFVYTRRDDHSWNWNRMRDQIIEIDLMLSRLRSRGLVFQDNTELIRDKFTEWKSLLIERLADVNAVTQERATFSVSIEEQRSPQVVITLRLNDPTITVTNEHNVIGEVNVGNCEFRFKFDLIKYINQLCIREIDEMRNSNINIKADGKTEDDDARSTSYPTLLFPYIGRFYNYRGESDPNSYRNICLGDFQREAFDAIAKSDLMALWIHMQGILRYDYPSTNPLNNLRLSFYGMPSHHGDSFRRIVGQNTEECANRLWNSITLDSRLMWVGPDSQTYLEQNREEAEESIQEFRSFCNDIDCTLRDECDRYREIAAHREPEENVVVQDIPGQEMTVNEQAEAHEVTAEEQAEAENVSEETITQDMTPTTIEPDQETDEQIQERMRQWANTWGNNTILNFDHNTEEDANV